VAEPMLSILSSRVHSCISPLNPYSYININLTYIASHPGNSYCPVLYKSGALKNVLL